MKTLKFEGTQGQLGAALSQAIGLEKSTWKFGELFMAAESHGWQRHWGVFNDSTLTRNSVVISASSRFIRASTSSSKRSLDVDYDPDNKWARSFVQKLQEELGTTDVKKTESKEEESSDQVSSISDRLDILSEKVDLILQANPGAPRINMSVRQKAACWDKIASVLDAGDRPTLTEAEKASAWDDYMGFIITKRRVHETAEQKKIRELEAEVARLNDIRNRDLTAAHHAAQPVGATS